MIEIGLEFGGKISNVVAAFVNLPVPVRPVHYSSNEDFENDANRVSNAENLLEFIAANEYGFFLLAPGCTYNIRRAPGKSIFCDCFLEVEARFAQDLLVCMARAQPIFCFACDPAEREERNKIVVRQGMNFIESWVGRDTEKYVPGFYWLTLLSDVLVNRHNISLPFVKNAAQEAIEMEGQHLFRFYENPEFWRETSVVSELCSGLSGVFNVEMVKREASMKNNFLELRAVLNAWR